MQNIYFQTMLIATVIMLSVFTHDIDAQKSSISINSNRSGSQKIQVKTPFTSFEIEYEGEIVISDDDSDIVSISDGGYFKIKKSAFGSKRKIEIDSDRKGVLTKKYYIGRREQPYIPQGEDWLAEMLPEVFQTTTVGAESRHERIYGNGGVNASILEIEGQDGDYSKTHYFGLLLNEELSNTELATVIASIGDEIDSDHYLSELLSGNRRSFLSSPEAINSYIQAAGSINSDHYLSEVLRDAIQDKSLSEGNISSMLEIVKEINSDHYVTEVLQTLLSDRGIGDQNLVKVLQLSDNIVSDHYKTKLLKDAISTKRDMDDHMLVVVLEALDDVSSDHYATEIVHAIKRQNLSDKMVAAVIEYSADNIASDHYKSVSMREMINRFEI